MMAKRYLCAKLHGRSSAQGWYHVISIDNSDNKVFAGLSQVPCYASS
jgi:hypothetical protein